MSRPCAFIAQDDAVYWITPGGSYELSVASVEDLLTVFDRELYAAAYNELHEAYVASGGVPRATSMRAA